MLALLSTELRAGFELPSSSLLRCEETRRGSLLLDTMPSSGKSPVVGITRLLLLADEANRAPPSTPGERGLSGSLVPVLVFGIQGAKVANPL